MGLVTSPRAQIQGADTASIRFEVTFSGTGTTLPRLGMDVDCGVTSFNAVARS